MRQLTALALALMLAGTARADGIFNLFDTDEDEAVNATELEAGLEEAEAIGTYDTDADGELATEEVNVIISNYDENDDFLLNETEFGELAQSLF